MKVYWVLAWDTYYPCGGLDDVKSTHAIEEEAWEAARILQGNYDYVTVEDIRNLVL